jgi:hypothetical protein
MLLDYLDWLLVAYVACSLIAAIVVIAVITGGSRRRPQRPPTWCRDERADHRWYGGPHSNH